MANYRIKNPNLMSNVANDVRIGGLFAVSSTTGAVGTIVRPSLGSGATAGQGNLFTVTQVTANKYLWRVVLTEAYFKPMWVDAQVMLVPTSGTAGTGGYNTSAAVTYPTAPTAGLQNNGATAALSCFATAVDAPANTGATDGSNSFYIYLADNAGAIPTTSPTVPANYTILINFEASFLNTTSPNTL